MTGGPLLDGLVRTAGSAYSLAVRVPVVGGVLQRRTEDVVALGERALAAAIVVARSSLKVIIREVIDALVVEVDLTELVRGHVDLNRIAVGIDVDRIAARIDIDAILDRVDIDRVIETVDLDRAVAGVDIDAVAAKIDVDAIIGRLDLIELANQIIDGVDLQAIVRDSTTTLTTGVLEDVRTQGARADDVVAGVVGRLLGRHDGKRAGRPVEPPARNGRHPDAGSLNGTPPPAEVIIEVHRRVPDKPGERSGAATDVPADRE